MTKYGKMPKWEESPKFELKHDKTTDEYNHVATFSYKIEDMGYNEDGMKLFKVIEPHFKIDWFIESTYTVDPSWDINRFEEEYKNMLDSNTRQYLSSLEKIFKKD